MRRAIIYRRGRAGPDGRARRLRRRSAAISAHHGHVAAHVRGTADANSDIGLQPCGTPARHSKAATNVIVDPGPETTRDARYLRGARHLDLVTG